MFPGCDKDIPEWVKEELTEGSGQYSVDVDDDGLFVSDACGGGNQASWDGEKWTSNGK